MNDTDEEDTGSNQPIWRFSLWDVAGITAHALCGTLIHVGQSVGLLSREFQAAANYSRQQRDLWEYRKMQEAEAKSAAAELRRVLEGGQP